LFNLDLSPRVVAVVFQACFCEVIFMVKATVCAVLFGSLAATAASAAELSTTIGWSPIPNTQLRTVCAAEHGFPDVWGNSGCPAITYAWSGAVFDTTRNRMIIFGGGHADYKGNELYSVDLNAQTITRLTDPGYPLATSCQEAIANGTQPNSRHTYDGIEYIPNADKMFVFGGSLACSSGDFGRDTWTFDFKTKTWKKMNPSGTLPVAGPGVMTAYDPNTGLVFLHDRKSLFSYDVNADKYTQLSSGDTLGYHLEATIDPKRKLFVIVGYDSVQGAGRVYTFDISGSTSSLKQRTTTGATTAVGQTYPGLDYDPVSDRIVAWDSDTPNNVYSLNLDTNVWTSTSYSGGPAGVANGTHGRFRYSPASGVFVLANSVDANVYTLRLSNSTAKVPNPPTNVSAQ
jgi:hypothetical protein